jgi:hypothetical protein
MHLPYFPRAFHQKWHALSFLSKEIVKVNDHVLQVVFIMFLGTYSTILGQFGGIKNLNMEINPFQPENPQERTPLTPPQISMSEPSSSTQAPTWIHRNRHQTAGLNLNAVITPCTLSIVPWIANLAPKFKWKIWPNFVHQHVKSECIQHKRSSGTWKRSYRTKTDVSGIDLEMVSRDLSHARDQRFPTYKLRICEIWANIPRQIKSDFCLKLTVWIEFQRFRKTLFFCCVWSNSNRKREVRKFWSAHWITVI